MDAELYAHPASPVLRIAQVRAGVERLSQNLLRFRYLVRGEIDALVLPAPAPPLRANNLWETTCFEAFLKADDAQSYLELNFSPSGRWAAYQFSAYRERVSDAPLPAPPEIALDREGDVLALTATVSLDLPEPRYRLCLAAVIEERGTERSFWSASHAGGEPDFHHDACFALELPAANAP